MSSDTLKFLEEKKALIDEMLRKYIPGKFDKAHVEWLLGKPSYDYTTKPLDKALAEPIWDFLDRGGKRWRPALFYCSRRRWVVTLKRSRISPPRSSSFTRGVS